MALGGWCPTERLGFRSDGLKHLCAGWKRSDSGSFTSGRGSRESLTIEHRYHFNSALKRMAAVVKLQPAGAPAAAWVVAKGAPEVMEQFLADVPSDYEASYKAHAAQGSRWDSLLACAMKYVRAHVSQHSAVSLLL